MTADPRATGERIEQLLEASATGGPVARERAEELVRLVVDLYGAGLERMLDLAYERGALTEQLLDDLAGDELVASLLLVHGLHPWSVQERVERALAAVRPYLGSHGGDVHLVGVTDEGVALLRMTGSCDGCPSSSVTLTLAVESAIRDAAPEVLAIELEEAPAGPAVIPVAALTARLPARWQPVGAPEDVPVGRAAAVQAGDLTLVATRIGADLYAFRPQCPHCTAPLDGAAVERTVGGREPVLTCPACRAHYDVRRAGTSTDHPGEHLEPLPLLVRDGRVEVAVPSPALA
ncbi:MAG: NifU family protein [Mycobacteriales bacterium]